MSDEKIPIIQGIESVERNTKQANALALPSYARIPDTACAWHGKCFVATSVWRNRSCPPQELGDTNHKTDTAANYVTCHFLLYDEQSSTECTILRALSALAS